MENLFEWTDKEGFFFKSAAICGMFVVWEMYLKEAVKSVCGSYGKNEEKISGRDSRKNVKKRFKE